MEPPTAKQMAKLKKVSMSPIKELTILLILPTVSIILIGFVGDRDDFNDDTHLTVKTWLLVYSIYKLVYTLPAHTALFYLTRGSVWHTRAYHLLVLAGLISISWICVGATVLFRDDADRIRNYTVLSLWTTIWWGLDAARMIFYLFYFCCYLSDEEIDAHDDGYGVPPQCTQRPAHHPVSLSSLSKQFRENGNPHYNQSYV
jgi:hypothetical protein